MLQSVITFVEPVGVLTFGSLYFKYTQLQKTSRAPVDTDCVVSVKGLQSTLYSIIVPDKAKPNVHFLAVNSCTQAN
jgi:hypothetical protein